MKCPVCKKELKIPERAYRNTDTYGESCVVTTECCKTLINLCPRREWDAYRYSGSEIEDDWGVPGKNASSNQKT